MKTESKLCTITKLLHGEYLMRASTNRNVPDNQLCTIELMKLVIDWMRAEYILKVSVKCL